MEKKVDRGELQSLGKEQFIYLTTRGRRTGKPHTVELWFALADGKIYLSHEGDRTDWMKNLIEDSDVTARIAELSFSATATIASETRAREAGKNALYVKYYGQAKQPVIDDWFELSTVVELTPASGIGE